MCNRCNQQPSCSPCGGYFSQSQVAPCLACDPVYVETQCGPTKLVAGSNISLTVGVDVNACRLLTVATSFALTTGAPGGSEGSNGDIRIDVSALRLYVKVDGTWRYVVLT